MRRRDFIASALSGIAMWPRAALAAPHTPVIGFLSGTLPEDNVIEAFLRGLSEVGYVAGTSVKIEYRNAEGQYDRLQRLATELKGLPVDVMVAVPSSPVALAARAVTSSIPIVFSIGADPVRLGLVQSYNRPGGNLTGMAVLANDLAPKRLELLHRLLPLSVPIAELLNPSNPNHEEEQKVSEQALRTLGRNYIPVGASNEGEIEAAFATVRDRKAALAVSFESYFVAKRALIVSLAERYSVVAVYGTRLFADIGGLISYGPDVREAFRLLGGYTGKILDGASPASLPVIQPTKLELVVNLKTAKALGLEIPAELLARADEAIE